MITKRNTSFMFVATLQCWIGLPLSRCCSSSLVSPVIMLKVITGIMYYRFYIIRQIFLFVGLFLT